MVCRVTRFQLNGNIPVRALRQPFRRILAERISRTFFYFSNAWNFCADFRKKNAVTRRKDHPDVYHVLKEDECMNRAMEKAALTLPYFD
jgi:hypothetical protein